MEKSVLGVGVIGCGAFCEAYISSLGSVFKNCRVLACSDIDMDRAAEIAAKWNITACTTEELLADPEIDIAVIVTGPASHYPLTMQALKAGKHVYCEKPMAVTVEQTSEIIALAEKKGLYVTVAPDTILDSAMQTARKALDDGLIGRPLSVTMNFIGPGPDWWHPRPDFFYKAGGGPAMDMGPYYLSAAVSILGPIAQMFAYASRGFDIRQMQGHECAVDVDTGYAAVLKFRSGVIGNINLSFDAVRSYSPGFEIQGTEGVLFIPDPNTLTGEVRYLNRDKLRNEVQKRETFKGVAWMYSPEALELAEELPRAVPRSNAHRGMGPADLADCIIKGDTEPRCSMYIARHITEALLAFSICAETGLPYYMQTTCERPDPAY